MTSEETLKEFNLRVTKIRLAVLDSLSQSVGALSYSVLQEALDKFDRTTLYRTLEVDKSNIVIVGNTGKSSGYSKYRHLSVDRLHLNQ